ncbi:related to Het-c protein [Claviceps purpurea 20.1]|uniref:Related to Het-c protein n=1 Tax=Claviceps purpurea (strain 20.1) TaxID=1111077 RepID=M1W8P0_CLAP2|nr:related to Het-c protein [Claviceps purpurea 20.1]
MLDSRYNGLVLGFIVLVALVGPAAAFGAGNIGSTSKVEGQNWRHGDIEDALLTLAMAQAMKHKKFNKIMVSRVYFGNWLRDYSQAIDVGTVKTVSAEAIRLLLCVLGFLTFGYGSGEFEVTADRLGCYRPEDHIDNPKNYADNKDARQYDNRLRGPIDEDRELAIDPESGMKNYIANDRVGIMTSSQHVRNLFTRCIELGRNYKNNGNKPDLYEALRLMGTGLHCLEDFLAHSNYCELALIEMGERDVFPHVGSETRMRLEGANDEVYPIVTGTFGGVDFLHSVVGEVSDKMTQNEIEELEGTLQDSKNSDTSLLRELLDKIPDSLFGGKSQKNRIDEIQGNAASSQLENMSVSPRNPEEFTVYVQQVYSQIMPAIEFHDDIMKSITSAVENIPVLPKIIEQLEEQLSRFVFSIMAPVVVPLIRQVKNELATGSGEVIKSSEDEQHVVFENDRCTDPTHSMLSKDHFSNILNEIAGRTAAKMVTWTVPQLMEAIDNDGTDVNRLCDRIVHGIMHHPAQRNLGQDGASEARNLMFQEVETWWGELRGEQDSYRQKLSRDGVERGENHKEGVDDTGHGHGCAGKLKMRKLYGEPDTLENKIAGAAADAIVQGATGLISDVVEQQTGMKLPVGGRPVAEPEEEEKSGFGRFLSKAGSILGEALGKDEGKSEERRSDNHNESYAAGQSSQSSYGRQENTQSYGRQENTESYGRQENTGSYGRQENTESYGRQDNTESYGRQDNTESYGQTQHSSSGYRHENRQERDDDNTYSSGRSEHHRRDNDDEGRRHEQHSGNNSYGRQQESHSRRRDDDVDEYAGRQESTYGGREESYGRQESSGRQESYGREESSYAGRQNDSYGGREESSYAGRQNDSYGGREESSYAGRQNDSYGGREESYGGNRSHGHRQESRNDDDEEQREEYGGREHHGRRQEGGYGGGSGYGY